MLFTALIGPYVVDWTAYRDTFEREASAYIGRPVSIAGKASVRLLPTPVLSFTNISIGDEGAPDVEIERFRAEVELAPLLKGEVRVIQMSVERPRFHVDLAALADVQQGGSAGGWRIDAERISLARLEIVGGTAQLSDSHAGRSWQADEIDAVVEAASLRGPAKIGAAFVLDGTPYSLNVAVGRFNPDDSVTAKATVASPRYPVTLSSDGTLLLAAGAPPAYKGTLTVAGIQPQDEDEPRSPWADFRATGAFELTSAALAIEAAQVSYGALERPLVLEASGRLDLGAAPRLDLSVTARQIDVDRALGGGAEQPVAIEDGLAALAAALPDLPRPQLPTVLHLDAQGVVIGGGVIQAVGADLASDAEGWRVDALSALLPGETQVDLTGTLRTQGDLDFRGHGRAASQRPAALAAWWRGRVGSAAQLSSFAIEADFAIEPVHQQLSNIVAATGAGQVKGSLDVRRFQQSGQLYVTVDLSADRAELVESRALMELLAGSALDPGRIDQVTLSLRADVLSAGGIEARSVALEGGLEGGRLDLRNFSVADLAGASVDARGSIADPFGAPAGRIDASVKAEDITGAAEFLAGILPENDAVTHLQRVAPLLSPMEAEISADTGAAGEPASLDLTGSFADTHLILTASGEGSLRDPHSLKGNVKLHVDGGDSAAVLAQLGLRPLPMQAGPLSFDASFDGSSAAGRFDVQSTIAGVSLSYGGETTLREGEVVAAGNLRAESADVDTALLLAGFAVPGLGEGHSASLSGPLEIAGSRLDLTLNEAVFDEEAVAGSIHATLGAVSKFAGTLQLKRVSLPVLASFAAGSVPGLAAGAWSDMAFSSAIPPGLALDFKVQAEVLDLGLAQAAGNAALQLGLADGAVNIDLAEAEFAGGKLKGSIAGTVRGGEAELTLRGALQGGQLQALVWERNGLPIASGLIDGAFDLTGGGRSMGGLVSSLDGSGSFAISDGRINALNPGALTAVVEGASGEGEPDELQARETFAIQFGSGALTFGRAAGSFAVSAGVLSVATVSVSAENTTALADARFDLNTLALESEWTIRSTAADEPGKAQPQVRITFSGPIGKPERRVDLSPLLDLLRSRYMQRQLDELEELEEARRQSEARQRAAEEAEANRLLPPQGPVAPGPDPTTPSSVPPPLGSLAPTGPAPPEAGPRIDPLPRDDAANPLAVPSLLAPI